MAPCPHEFVSLVPDRLSVTPVLQSIEEFNMKSKLCQKLDIQFPLIAFSHCRDVVVEVSKAGGIGVLGAAGFLLSS